MKATVLLAIAGLTACQSYSSAIKVLCEAPQHVPAGFSKDPSKRSVWMAGHIRKNLTNVDAIHFLGEIASMDDAERKRRFLEEAKKAGLHGCPMVEQDHGSHDKQRGP